MKFRDYKNIEESLEDKLRGSRAIGIDIGPIKGSKKKQAKELAVQLLSLGYGDRASSFIQLAKNRQYIPGILDELRKLGAEVLQKGGTFSVIYDGNKNITKELLKRTRK